MKKSFIVFGLCLLLVGMPVGFSDCGCTLPNDASAAQQSVQPWISDAYITALQKQGLKERWTFTVGKNLPRIARCHNSAALLNQKTGGSVHHLTHAFQHVNYLLILTGVNSEGAPR